MWKSVSCTFSRTSDTCCLACSDSPFASARELRSEKKARTGIEDDYGLQRNDLLLLQTQLPQRGHQFVEGSLDEVVGEMTAIMASSLSHNHIP